MAAEPVMAGDQITALTPRPFMAEGEMQWNHQNLIPLGESSVSGTRVAK